MQYSINELTRILDKSSLWLRTGLSDNPQGSRANLTRADLTDANLAGADLADANLTRADLAGANLIRANLTRANLAGANLAGADLAGADLAGANLAAANLADADLADANLTRADLAGANLTRANLADANLTDANLTGADLWGTIGDSRYIFTMQLPIWPVCRTADTMQIGCQQHLISDWWDFDDDRIAQMAPEALSWWRAHKDLIRLWVDTCPAEPMRMAIRRFDR